MANLDDLDFVSILDMSTDEAIELFRQVRLKRRTPVKTTRMITKKSVKTTEISADQAAAILAILKGENR